MIENLNLGWPQLVFLAISFLSLGVDLARHGEPKTGKYNFGTSVFAWACITLPLLYAGGFFTKP